MYKSGRVKGGKCVLMRQDGTEVLLLDAAETYQFKVRKYIANK